MPPAVAADSLPPNSATQVSGAIADGSTLPVPAGTEAGVPAGSPGAAQAIVLEEGIVVPPPPRPVREDTGAYRALWLAAVWSDDGHLLDGEALALPSGWQRGLAPVAGAPGRP
jgi:hypothetical protein